MPARLAACLVGALSLVACATARKPAAPGLFTTVTPAGVAVPMRWLAGDPAVSNAALSAQIWQRLQRAAGDGPINILALSGGGAGGAFAAGALSGLDRAGTRPRFALVTGVSTGALVAPFAFLGPAWDTRMSQAFVSDRAAQLLRYPGAGLLLHPSVYSGRPLAKLVDELYPDDLIDAVGAEAATGRTLLIATTDLDKQLAVIWDLGAIAARGEAAGRNLFRKLLVASASYPGLLPPVLIRVLGTGHCYDEMHVDGGASVPFFISPLHGQPDAEAFEKLRGAHVYLLVNRQLDTAVRTTTARLPSIVQRSLSTSTRHLSRTTLELDAELAHRYGLTLQAASIPVDYSLKPFEFEPTLMRQLFDYGRRCAERGQLWSTPEHALERGTRQPPAPSGTAARCPSESGAPSAVPRD